MPLLLVARMPEQDLPADSNPRRRNVPLPPFWREVGSVVGLYLLSVIALAWLFPPNGLWPLAFVALVPWAVATCRTQRAWLVHWLSFIMGWVFFLVALRWLMPVTGLGYAALGLYLALFWTLAAWAIRTGRRHHIAPVWTLPFIWVACEFLRGTLMTGFPWMFLAHGLYGQLHLIQISDLVGAYGVSFLAAFVNGALVELLLLRWPVAGTKPNYVNATLGAITAAVLFGATLGYGFYQLDESRGPAKPGPRVAVVQEDFPLVSTPPYGDHPYVVLTRYLTLGAQAAREQPDLLAFPETAWNSVQNIDYVEADSLIPEAMPAAQPFGRLCHDAVSALARGDYAAVNAKISEMESNLRVIARIHPELDLPETLPRLPTADGPAVPVLVGAVSIEQYPHATYPKMRRFNSALLYDPDGKQRRERYDKQHLVPFGEVVPFRQAKFLGFDLHWLYRGLNRLSPFSDGGHLEYSLSSGDQATVFRLTTADGTYRFGVPICYEDTVPRVPREFVWDNGKRRVDFLINISNDGWFLHSNELPQHLAICVFRAVENRVAIARAVNTGISAFVDGNGRIFSRVEVNGRSFGPGVIGYDIAQIPLDTRKSFYGLAGDWFAMLCLAPALALWIGAVFERWVLAIKHRLSIMFGKGGS
jgi:apolipoprotein N-acyltransferase